MASRSGFQIIQLRCPVCLMRHDVDVMRRLSDSRLRCSGCKHNSEQIHWLPVSQNLNPYTKTSTVKTPTANPPTALQTHSISPLWGIGGVAAVCLFSYFFTEGMKGPEFLNFYFLVGLVLLVAVAALRSIFKQYWMAGLLAGIAFEGVGGIRYETGVAAGMHKFDYLFVMMVIGGILFLFSALDINYSQWNSGRSSSSYDSSSGTWTSDSTIGSSDSGSSSSSDSGGGCGGGGGGGGCGGCGGGGGD